jgi:hypothetical protein
VAPNLSALIGEIVGARLISHAGVFVYVCMNTYMYYIVGARLISHAGYFYYYYWNCYVCVCVRARAMCVYT